MPESTESSEFLPLSGEPTIYLRDVGIDLLAVVNRTARIAQVSVSNGL